MTEQLYNYDPAQALTSTEAIAEFMTDAYRSSTDRSPTDRSPTDRRPVRSHRLAFAMIRQLWRRLDVGRF